MIVCKKCGAELNDDVKFCMACGTWIDEQYGKTHEVVPKTEKGEEMQGHGSNMQTQPISFQTNDGVYNYSDTINEVDSDQFSHSVSTQPSPYSQPEWNSQYTSTQWTPQQYQQNSRRGGKKALIILSIVVLLFVVVGVSSFAIIHSAEESNSYDVGKDSIPSIKAVLGERNISGVSTNISQGEEKKEYKYSGIQDPQSDIKQYVGYLRKNSGYFLTTDYYNMNDTSGNVQLGSEAKESGEIILIKIDWNQNTYTITVEKGPGTLTKYN